MFVLEDSGDGGVVEGATADEVGPGRHEEGGVGEEGFGFKEDVHGLAWRYEKGGGSEWFDVGGVSFNHGEGMIGNTEEELVVECSIDQSKQICFAWLHF